MLNKDKRSLVMSLVLGDGCLHYIKNGGRVFGGLTIDHGLEQSDYQSWKAKLLSDVLGRNVKMRPGHKGKSVQVSVCMKRFRSWRKFCYPKERKSLPIVLKFINNPWFAVAVWLMDDGYCEPSFSKLADGSKKNYGARFRIFTSTCTPEEMSEVKQWLDSNLEINSKITYHRSNKQNTSYPLIKINTEDTLKIWKNIREFVLQFKSMRYKFRHIEALYQYRIL